MTTTSNNEIIIVRSLTESDLGLFAALRPTISSKQRAMNINATVAQQLFSAKILSSTGTHLECRIIFNDIEQTSVRHFGKIHKNWRLGGNKIEGPEFASLDSRDFALIRSVEQNDGSSPLTILLVSKTVQRLKHAAIGRLVEHVIRDSMAVFLEGSAGFRELAVMFPDKKKVEKPVTDTNPKKNQLLRRKQPTFPPMPADPVSQPRSKSVKEKVRSPRILEQMLKVSGDLSAKAQMTFLDTIGILASQLREALTISGRIIRLEKNHSKAWQAVKGKNIGFVDGGLANLTMLGSSPIAARVGGYIVQPGNTTTERERFLTLKKLINELFTDSDNGVYSGNFPDAGALRDAARISIEAAGAVKVITEEPALHCLFLHGALVNPVSRYTDIMRDGESRFQFPAFSKGAISELLAGIKPAPSGRNANFIPVYLRQLQAIENSTVSVCGVIEREATTTSVIRNVLDSLDDNVIADVLSLPPSEWKQWFRSVVDPADEDESLGQRITDSLLFRCVLEPGEVLVPVEINRNEMRRAPLAWQDIIAHYPKPLVSYLLPNEWSSPIRLEVFHKDREKFINIADLVYHCALLLPQYAFPAGLDIVDKYAKIPNWMSRPVNTNTAVQALKQAMNKGDEKLFDALRWILCGSDRDWMFRPGINR